MSMDMQEIPENYQNDIKQATNLLKNEGCKDIFLFGSLVTGRFHKNSDIDIGITGVNNHHQRWWLECWPLKGALTPCNNFPITAFPSFIFRVISAGRFT